MCVRGHIYVCYGYRFCLCFHDFSIGFRNFPTAWYLTFFFIKNICCSQLSRKHVIKLKMTFCCTCGTKVVNRLQMFWFSSNIKVEVMIECTEHVSGLVVKKHRYQIKWSQHVSGITFTLKRCLFGNTLTCNDIIYDIAQIFFYVIPAIGKRAYCSILFGNTVDRNGWN